MYQLAVFIEPHHYVGQCSQHAQQAESVDNILIQCSVDQAVAHAVAIETQPLWKLHQCFSSTAHGGGSVWQQSVGWKEYM